MLRQRRKLRLKKYDVKWYIISLLLTFRYMLPLYFDNIIKNNSLLDMCIALIPLMAGLFIIISGKVRFNVAFIPFALLYLLLIFSTFKNQGNLVNVLIHSAHVLMLCVVVDLISTDEKKLTCFLKAVRDFTFLFFCLNYIITWIYPTGIPSITESKLFPNFLYGNVNSTIKYIIAGICCSCILDKKNGKRISLVTFLFIAGVLENAFRVYMTATAVIAVLFILVWMLFMDRIIKHERAVYLAVLVGIGLFEFSIVLSGAGLDIVYLITSLFNKSSDFSGRGRLWANTISLIKKNWVWGYGQKSREFLKLNIGNNSGAHNYFLDILFQRGIFAEIIFVGTIISPYFLMRGRTVSTEQYILLGCCCSCYLMFLVEPFYTTEFLIMPIIYMFICGLTKKILTFNKGRVNNGRYIGGFN